MNKSWKKAERRAAQIIGGARHWANSGQKIDAESDAYCAQVKEVKTQSLAQLEALALESERQGAQKSPPKMGVVITKRRAGNGNATPVLITMTESVFNQLKVRLALAEMTRRDA